MKRPAEFEINDIKLENEADAAGKAHGKKHPGQTEFLPRYGTTEFGMKAYEEKPLINFNKVLWLAGVAVAGFFAWKYRDRITKFISRQLNIGR